MPPTLKALYTSPDKSYNNFRSCVRTYNNTFAFTSLGIHNYEKDLCRRNKGIYTFKVQGQIYHFINDLLPDGCPPRNLQLYFYDTDHEVENRVSKVGHLDEKIVSDLIEVMSHNPYAKFFRSLKDLVHSDEFSISLQSCPSLDQRIYNAPTTSQVAAVWIEDFEGSGDNRNIRVYAHSGRAQNIQYYYGCYDPLQYPLLFPFGDAGWHEGIERVFPNNTSTRNTYASALYINANDVSNVEELLQAEETVFRERKKRRSVSCREYYAYKFQMRSGDTSLLLHTGRLFQQFIVDIYIKVETQRLDYFRKKQQLCRSENFQGLVDSVSTGAVFGNDVGRRVILPSSFIGGPRDMRGRYMDAMSLVQNFGKPDFFLTITCNPNWPEIKRLLEFNDEAHNRPDLVARVFHAKLQELKNDITKKHFFGEISAYTYVIEFQKRGLPHAHFLIILKNKSMMSSSSFVDEYVCAEIPNKETQPTLYDLVKKHMVHGPCGSLNQTCPCMVQKKCQTSPSCKSKYPRSFCPETRFDDDSYPIYKRRNTSFFVQIKGFKLDNRWIVPYNPQLLLKFDCHINVEVCATIKSVKYIYKYIYKGHDRVRMSLADNMSDYVIDEIKEYQNARCISPPEAAWRIYGFAIAELKPAVIQLQVHLENSQYINFYGHERIIHIVSREEACRTMLTEFFSMNLANEYAKMMNLLYVEFPCHFVWCKSTKSWKPRKQLKVIGRLVTVNPTEGERYYLRMLLMNVRAPTSFESLKTINGYFAETFREAVEKLGLLSGDSIIEQSLDEALLFQMPSSLRKLFAMLLIFCDLSNPRSLWIKYKSYMCQDFLRNGLHTIDESESLVLKLIANNLHKMGKNLYDYNLVDTFTELDIATTMTHEIMYERSLEVSESDLAGVQKLNACQRAAFDTIIENVFANKGGIYFVDGPAGTGKTFLYRCLLATVRSRGFLALATATSGIAASILPGGRTAHSRFKLPLDGDDKHICNIGKQTAEARLLKECKLILWDEASMANRKIIESLDTSLKDIMECNDLFGGKVIVFGGDFRQTLPIVRHGKKEDFIEACLVKSSLIWPHIRRLTLTQNMRAQEDHTFADYLMRIGNGSEKMDLQNKIKVPSHLLIKNNGCRPPLDVLFESVYPDLGLFSNDPYSLMERAILTTKNEFVDEINFLLLDKFPGANKTYISYDEPSDSKYLHCQDYLHTLSPAGLPPHMLCLKKSCPVILLRNLNPCEGLCNGTRLICDAFGDHIISCVIAVGEYKGKHVLIPRIPLQTSKDDKCVIPFKRTQFPIKVCFAMTINKSQGQTLDFVGIYLKEPVFSHGQLYVAMSRAKTASSLKILICTDDSESIVASFTQNIVYREIIKYIS
ncbi:uncharacterized protein LOC116020565 [Ipomoea triloba]|uniref:uncharacterized protein LOC116020565 n=1 Tax=Ipomoea triloba TaxID=35885 RepID=UPI00125DED19|nr:uncharacterized protein LOC116020565 [Ipomoea triloba]